MKGPARLRQLLASDGLIMAPGVFDGISAKLAASRGFEVVYMTGAGACASRLGRPDVGLVTLTEMAEQAQNVSSASGLPVIADADDGFGGVINVMRTVERFERAGVAAIHIEDQQLPKRCGHLSGKAILPVAEMQAKIRAAVHARSDPDFVVIARTDALAVEGFDAALDRARAYEQAGADMIFVESPLNMEQVAAIPRAFSSPAVFNMASSGKTPFIGREEIAQLGYKVAIYPIFALLAAVKAMGSVYDTLRDEGTVAGIVDDIASFRDFFSLMGLAEVQELERSFGVDEKRLAAF